MSIEIEEEQVQHQTVVVHGFIKWILAIASSLVVAALVAITGGMWQLGVQMAEDRGKADANFSAINLQLGLIRDSVNKTENGQFSSSQGQDLVSRVERLEMRLDR